MGILTSIYKILKPVMDPLTVAFVHPIKTVQAIISPTKTVAQLIEKHFEEPLSSQLIQTAATTIGYAGAIVGAGAIAAKGITAATAVVGKALIPTTIKGAAVEAAVIMGGLIAAPLIIQSEKARKVVAAIPEQLSPEGLTGFGSQVADFIENPQASKLTQIAKDNPILLAAIAAAVVIAGGAALNVYNTWKTRQAVQKGAEATAEYAETTKELLELEKEKAVTGAIVPEKAIKTDEGIPLTTETARITTGKKRRRKAKTALIPSMRQIVQVSLSNRSIGFQLNKRYLNERILA